MTKAELADLLRHRFDSTPPITFADLESAELFGMWVGVLREVVEREALGDQDTGGMAREVKRRLCGPPGLMFADQEGADAFIGWVSGTMRVAEREIGPGYDEVMGPWEPLRWARDSTILKGRFYPPR
jgi:hypothetical protein